MKVFFIGVALSGLLALGVLILQAHRRRMRVIKQIRKRGPSRIIRLID